MSERQPRRTWPAIRAGLTAVNGTTAVALLIAAAARTPLRRAPGGVLVASGYRLPVPAQSCFTVGAVIFTRRHPDHLLDPGNAELLAHEIRHVSQYAVLGPLFWPAYWAACGYSWLLSGGYGGRNPFERHAGLAAGGYREPELRPWAARTKARTARTAQAASAALRGRSASSSSRRGRGTRSPR